MNIYCSGPHIQPVILYTVELPNSVTRIENHQVLCVDCVQIYQDGIMQPEFLSNGAPNPAWRRPGSIPTLHDVTMYKRRAVPDWTPARDNYGKRKN